MHQRNATERVAKTQQSLASKRQLNVTIVVTGSPLHGTIAEKCVQFGVSVMKKTSFSVINSTLAGTMGRYSSARLGQVNIGVMLIHVQQQRVPGAIKPPNLTGCSRRHHRSRSFVMPWKKHPQN